MEMSYMVGYGRKFPVKIHHRGSCMPSIDAHPRHITCKGGTYFFEMKYRNYNMLTGAIVGGPDENDLYIDDRNRPPQSEPTTYINAPFVGVLAYFKSNSQLELGNSHLILIILSIICNKVPEFDFKRREVSSLKKFRLSNKQLESGMNLCRYGSMSLDCIGIQILDKKNNLVYLLNTQ